MSKWTIPDVVAELQGNEKELSTWKVFDFFSVDDSIEAPEYCPLYTQLS